MMHLYDVAKVLQLPARLRQNAAPENSRGKKIRRQPLPTNELKSFAEFCDNTCLYITICVWYMQFYLLCKSYYVYLNCVQLLLILWTVCITCLNCVQLLLIPYELFVQRVSELCTVVVDSVWTVCTTCVWIVYSCHWFCVNCLYNMCLNCVQLLSISCELFVLRVSELCTVVVDSVWGMSFCSSSPYVHRVREKKRPRYFQLQLSHFMVDFYNFRTIGNRNEYFVTMWNLLT